MSKKHKPARAPRIARRESPATTNIPPMLGGCPCGSGLAFHACHGSIEIDGLARASEPERITGAIVVEPKLPMAAPTITRKLDLACGQTCREGFEGVDIWPGAPIVHDLSIYPWPFEDNSVAELHCSHYIEHIYAGYVNEYGDPVNHGGQDALLKFFDECWRILVHDGLLTVQCPNARSNRAFQDPTHRRFIVAETFLYLWKEWRVANKLDHYGVRCNFGANVVPIVQIEMNARHPEVQQLHFNSYWNSILDWSAQLKAIK